MENNELVLEGQDKPVISMNFELPNYVPQNAVQSGVMTVVMIQHAHNPKGRSLPIHIYGNFTLEFVREIPDNVLGKLVRDLLIKLDAEKERIEKDGA